MARVEYQGRPRFRYLRTTGFGADCWSNTSVPCAWAWSEAAASTVASRFRMVFFIVLVLLFWIPPAFLETRGAHVLTPRWHWYAWKERFRHAQSWACFKRCLSIEITSFARQQPKPQSYVSDFMLHLFLQRTASFLRLSARISKATSPRIVVAGSPAPVHPERSESATPDWHDAPDRRSWHWSWAEARNLYSHRKR